MLQFLFSEEEKSFSYFVGLPRWSMTFCIMSRIVMKEWLQRFDCDKRFCLWWFLLDSQFAYAGSFSH